MKALLLPLLFLFSASLFAQADQDAVIKKKLDELRRRRQIETEHNKVWMLPNRNKNITPLSYLQNPKPGVHRLPQDGMPCIVPDTKDIAAIPNAAPRVEVPFRSRIPNGSPLQPPLQKRDVE